MTMAWKLNQFPLLEVSNLGCPGYGLLQMYLWMKQNFEAGNTPKIVAINYGAFHDQRSILSQSWQNSITVYNEKMLLIQYPYTRIKKGKLDFGYKTPQYFNLWGSKHFATIHLMQVSYFAIQRKLLNERKVTQLLLKKIQALIESNHSTLIVCGIDENRKTKETIKWCLKNDIIAVDIGLDLLNPKYNLMPNDIHPNSLANTLYANKLHTYLTNKTTQLK